MSFGRLFFFRFLLFYALSPFFPAHVAYAETLDEYVQRLSKHPQVQAILVQGEAYAAQAQGEMGLPDPMFMLGVDNIPVSDPSFSRFLPSSKVIGVSQAIPNSASRTAKSRRLKIMSKKNSLLADYTKARLRYMLISKLAEYQSVKTQQDLLTKQIGFYGELEDTLKGQLEAGGAVYQRFSEIDVERAEAERNLNDLSARQAEIEADFIRLVDKVPDIELPEMADPQWDQDPMSLYPVKIAAEDIKIAEQGVNIADAAFLPNWGIDASYKQREDGQNGMFAGDDWFSVKVRMSVPLWAGSNQKPKLKAAKEHQRSVQFAYENQARDWKKRMASLFSSYEAASRNMKTLQAKSHAIDKKVEAAQRNYEAGSGSLDAVLLAQIDRLNILAQLAAVQEMNISLGAEITSNIINANHEVSE